MAALLNVQNNIMYLDSLNQRYKLLYPKLSSLSDDERRELESIKKESLTTLGQIMSMNVDDILKENYKEKIALLSQGITSVLNEKEADFSKIQDANEKADGIIEEIAKGVCKLETLDSNLAIKFDIEKMLFYLKNKVVSISLIDKKLFALDYLREKINAYSSGMYKLILLSRKHKSKKELSFDEKQEVFEVFSSISFEYHYDINHSKVFNEDLNNEEINLNTTDYIICFENLFIELLEVVGVSLEKFTNEILELVNNSSATKTNIENYCKFLGNKYDSDIVVNYDSLVEKKIESVTDIKDVIHNCFIYEENKDYNYILAKMSKNHRLPEFLIGSEYRKYLEDILFDYSFKTNSNINGINEIIDEVSSLMFERFDPDKYLKIYDYNLKQKNKQIALFKDYLNELLLKAKDVLREKYRTELENKIEENMLEEYNTSKVNEDTKKKEKDIEILKKAEKNIKEKYSQFDDYAYLKYISSIENAFCITGLGTEISIKKKSLFYSLKSRNLSKKDTEYVVDFLKSEEINKEILKNFAYDIIVGNDSIRYEVLSKILG